jgi:tRNA modification GTPase
MVRKPKLKIALQQPIAPFYTACFTAGCTYLWAMLRNDIICALATPAGVGAIAVVRLSGTGCIALVDKVYTSPAKNKKLQNQAAHTVHFGIIAHKQEMIDEVLVTLFHAPRSFTGEESVEISSHGSVFIQNKLLQVLIDNGARMADPGEFTMRAFMNGKMDLSQAEAVADLIFAENESAHKVAMQQMRGGFSKEIAALREELINFASLIELELDFAEEDVEFANRDNLMLLLKKIEVVLHRLIQSFGLGNVIKNGIPVAIVGAPNAGKSTLLNALLNEERAIVSHIAGTTRDAIEDEIHLGGITFRFIDTAGLRQTTDFVESIGIKKALEKIEQAHIVLYVYDAAQPPHDTIHNLAEVTAAAKGKPLIILANKTDAGLAQLQMPEAAIVLKISAKNNQGIDELKNVLVELAGTKHLNNNQVIVTNARHFESLNLALTATNRVVEGIQLNASTDLLSEDVREALRHLGNITGAIELDRDILGTIFGKFCIGK